ncbi:MAG TPA: ATP-binding protein [Bryobacteraceae bacterium]|nr:ATP-binding protein [Bryobacteraceae bacterium]
MSLRRFLVVGDEPIRESLAGLLEHHHAALDCVSHPGDALAHLRSAPYDLAITGYGTNGADPLKMLRRFHTIRPDLKVIVTGDASPSRALEAIRSRAYGYMHLPFSSLHLGEMVQQALDSAAWRDDIRLTSARLEWVTLDIQCKLEAAERATHLARELAADLDPNAAEDFTSAFRELLLNGIEHGGKSNPRKRVRVSLLRLAGSLVVQIRDPGKGFSFEKIQHAAVSNPDDSPTRHVEIRAEQGQRPGGFGILMARNLVDQLLYNERGNEVIFVKKFTRFPPSSPTT